MNKKNIFLIPTNNPTKLAKTNVDVLGMYKVEQIAKYGTNQNVYITAYENIGVGDWYININFNDILLYKSNQEKKGNRHKIILTTDEQLIKEGIQAIDDEFLEWLIENPTCESIKVNDICDNVYVADFLATSTHVKYEIIIPKEKVKQIICRDKLDRIIKEGYYVDVQKSGIHKVYKKEDGQLYFTPYGKEEMVSSYFSNDLILTTIGSKLIMDLKKEIKDKKQQTLEETKKMYCKERFLGDKRAVQCKTCANEMVNIKSEVNDEGGVEIVKQETLEEAAENYSENWEEITGLDYEDSIPCEVNKIDFIEGAKWQSKRMYSEEELKEIINKTLIEYSEYMLAYVPEWFEKFKKK